MPMQAGQSDATVKTVVKQSGKPALPIDYRLSSGSGDWKVNDVVVNGMSLITTYRGTFSEEINRAGVDGLIKMIEDKNRAIAGA
jgi:phospholipid transport system substrate-binding protein